jgi:Tol biopolymer transport system component
MPAWSPGGDRIAYSGEVDGIFQIFVRKIGSPAPTQITRQDASCFDPFWSPDGSRIYYIVSRGTPDENLWSSAVAGGAAEKVLDSVNHATISPDGKTLAVEALQPDKTYVIMLSSPPGAPPRPLPQSSIPALRSALPFGNSLQFTVDGKYLGILGSDQKSGLWKVPMNGGAPEELLHGHYIADAQPRLNWFSNGSIIWSWTNNGDAHVVETDFRHGKDRQITSGAGQEKYAALSPDGRTLAFQTGDSGYGLFEVPLNGAPPSRVITTDRHEVAPGWAPDGVHFAYVTDRNGNDEIWLRNRADGSEKRIVSTLDLPHSAAGDAFLDCAISPDGSRVAYRSDTGSKISIWISSLAGDTPVPLYDDPQKAFQRGPSWSPDGNSMAYYSVHDGKPAVMKIRVGSLHPPDLVTYVATPRPVRWSPKGDWLAWDDAGKLTLVSPEGKQRRIVSRKQWFTYSWSKDGDALFGISLSENHHLVIGRIDAASERETTVADLGPAPAMLDLAQFESDFPYRGFSLHPDGKSFLTSALGIKGDIWLLENFDSKVGLMDRVLRRR